MVTDSSDSCVGRCFNTKVHWSFHKPSDIESLQKITLHMNPYLGTNQLKRSLGKYTEQYGINFFKLLLNQTLPK